MAVATAGTASTIGTTVFKALEASLGFIGAKAVSIAAVTCFETLVPQATVSLINNKGNISKVLQELGSKESLKNLAQSVVTNLVVGPPPSAKSMGVGGLFETHLKQGLMRGGINSAFGNKGFSFKDIVVESALKAVAAKASNAVGEHYRGKVEGGLVETIPGIPEETRTDFQRFADGFEHKVMHGVLGGSIAALRGQSFAEGAVSAVVAETVADLCSNGSEERALKKAQAAAEEEKRPLTQSDLQSAIQDEMRSAARWGELSAYAVGACLEFDPETTSKTVKNALDNNFVVSGTLLAMAVGSAQFNVYWGPLMTSWKNTRKMALLRR